MRKIPTVLLRDPADMSRVLPEVTPGCEWVLAGEGIARRKFDGTCVCLTDDGRWLARREVRPGKSVPAAFDPIATDEVTGRTVGWVPIEQSPFVAVHHDALERGQRLFRALGLPGDLQAGTYELCGPKINGNPDQFPHAVLMYHAAAAELPTVDAIDTPVAVMEFARWCGQQRFEGAVWHHPDGRMAKIKARDVRHLQAVAA